MRSIDFVDYEVATRSTAIYPSAGSGSYDALQYVALGLVGEAGEVAGKIKKIYRDKAGVVSEDDAKELAKEIGDVLWYAARFADELGINLEEIAKGNLEKLASRKERGVIGGSGDNR